MSICKLNECNFSIILHNINNHNILNHNTNIISILNNNNTLHKMGVETLEVEDNKKEEYLAEEEAKSYVIIVGSHDILLDIFKVLQKIVHIVNILITLLNSVHN